jgi:hypothetical protein
MGNYRSYPAQWKEIYSQFKSHKMSENEAVMKPTGLAQITPEGTATRYDTMNQRYTTQYVHQTFSTGFIITEQAIEDNLYRDQFPNSAKLLRQSFETTKNIQGASILNNAFDPLQPGGDGVPLASSAHPVAGNTYSNVSSPMVGFNEASLEEAITAIRKFKNEAGYPMMTRALRIIVPPELDFTAARLLESHFRTATANNDINAIYNMKAVPKGYMVNDFLTDPNTVYIMTDVENAFKYFERTPLRIDMNVDIDTGNLKVRGTERYSFGNSDPRGLYVIRGA